MAQPPEINDTFLREVDENLRRDQMRDFGKKYGKWLIVAVILFLLASGGIIWWQQHKKDQAAAQVEQLADTYRAIGTGDIAKAQQQLDQLSNSSGKAIRASALFTRAALAIEKNDSKTAIAKYREIAGEGSFPAPYRDAATIRLTALEFDKIKPDEVIARVKPLAVPGNPWFGSAGEMTAMALIKQGKKPEAGRLFAAIAKDKSVPIPSAAVPSNLPGVSAWTPARRLTEWPSRIAQ